MKTKMSVFSVLVLGVFLLVLLSIVGRGVNAKDAKSTKHENNAPYPDNHFQSKSKLQYCGTSTRRTKHMDEYRFAKYVKDMRDESDPNQRHQRDVSPGSAVYFTGRSDALSYIAFQEQTPSSTVRFPRNAFSVALWVKPDGGQNSPAVIMGLLDTCRGIDNHWTWSIGINTEEDKPGQDARFFFSVTTDRSPTASMIRGTSRYEAETWTHLAASYDGRKLTLYVNGAKVSAGQGVIGPMFSEVMLECKQLVVGGSINDDNGFRGAVDQVTIWSEARPHRELKPTFTSSPEQRHVVLQENFDDDWLNWKTAAENEPIAITSDIKNERHRLVAKIPPCGVTICDSPIVAKSYTNKSELRLHKTVKYRAITMADDDGSNPIINRQYILDKHAMINEAFRPHNISWELTEFVVTNTSLRNRVVLAQCNLGNIGDERCDQECSYDVTGDDAGDCLDDYSDEVCLEEQIGNGVCETICNTGSNDYDGGDCCDPIITDVTVTCIDPYSLHRNYLTEGELKGTIAMESNSHLNVYFANFAGSGIEGKATMPWELDVHGLFGGTVLQANNFIGDASSETIIHELGHNLGLLHVHQSMECLDECRETTPSDILGDLVQDTNPTPLNGFCRDPTSCDTDTCFGETEFKSTPYRNYMSYSDSHCTDHFTQQQAARMHCYLDLVYQSWLLPDSTISPITTPLSPRVVEERPHSITLSWLPPVSLYGDSLEEEGACLGCTEGSRLMQYASSARFFPESWYSPDKATGAPDAHIIHDLMASSWIAYGFNTVCDECYLELGFKTAVAPSKLIIWSKYNKGGGIRNLELQFRDGSLESLGSQQIFSDLPLTLQLTHINRKVQAIRIYPDSQSFSLDAVQLVSVAGWSGCVNCEVMKYKILRDPPFSDAEEAKVIKSTVFTDNDVETNVTYSYRIQADSGDENSALTSPLRHRYGKEFCGNGRKERNNGEECDDGNVQDGDGCSMDCNIEDSFVCKGELSICSHTTANDMSLAIDQASYDIYQPEDGFQDQWVVSAEDNPRYQSKSNPVSALYGPPSTTKCVMTVDNGYGWYPYGYEYNEDYWIKVRFSEPVVATAVIVHLSSDGINPLSPDVTSISLELMGPDGAIHGEPISSRPVTCQDNPVQFNITQDLNIPFSHTQEVKIRLNSFTIAISAVRLRSRLLIDPVTMASCQTGQLFNPATGQCVSYECTWPECDALTIPHAVVNCTGVREGDTCNVRCLEGYSTGMNSDTQVLCRDSEWHGPDRPMLCKAVDCGDPSLPYAEVVCPMGTTYGKQCKLKCVPPAKMQGTKQTVTCMADGLYSLPEAFCQLQCDIPYVDNAVLISQQCQTGSHNIGTICKFRCDEGYHVIDQPSKRRKSHKLKYKCTDDATWSGPTCEPVKCQTLPMIFNDLYICTDGNNFNSQCYLRCDDVSDDVDIETLNSIRCIQDPRDTSRGIWDGTFALCKSFEGSCNPPQERINNGVQFTCDNGYTVGSRCAVVCPDIYGLSDNEPALLAINSTSRFITDTDWMDANHMITCNTQREWLPNPERITCVEGCYQRGIGNGICQQINNRAYCNWDGGDCCASTNIYGEVITITGIDTVCLDPDAEENQPTNGSNRKNRF